MNKAIHVTDWPSEEQADNAAKMNIFNTKILFTKILKYTKKFL